jgi:hypothetical protein
VAFLGGFGIGFVFLANISAIGFDLLPEKEKPPSSGSLTQTGMVYFRDGQSSNGKGALWRVVVKFFCWGRLSGVSLSRKQWKALFDAISRLRMNGLATV